MIPARQSTAFETAIGPVLDADGVAVTGCVVGDFKIKKTTGNFAALNASATLTHVSAGVYDLVLTTSDTDTVGLCCIAIDDTTNACQSLYLQVMEEAVYDDLYAASAVGYLKPTTAGRTLDVTATGAAGIDWGNVENQSTSVNLSATTTNLVNTLTTYTGSTPQTGDSYAIVNSGTHGNAALKTLIDAVDNFVDTEIADLSNRIPAALVSGRMDSNMQAAANDVITAAVIAAGAIDRATFAADTGLQTIRSNTAQGGSTSSITLDASASAVNNFYDGMRCRITGGTGIGQEALLYQYNGTTKAGAVAPTWKTAPDNTSTFAITGTGASDFQLLAGVESYMGGVADFFQQFSDNGTVTGFATDTELAKVPKSDSNVTWNATAAAQIQSEATDALNAYDPPTNAEMEARTLPSADYGTNTDVDAILALLDTEFPALVTTVGSLFTTARTEAYRTDGAAGTIDQLLYEIVGHLGESSISSVTKTMKKIDGSTTAMTFTLSDATTPTSITRAT